MRHSNFGLTCIPLLAVMISIPSYTFAADAAAFVAQVKVSRGVVKIQRSGQAFPAPVGTRLKVDDVIATGGNGSVGMMFADNSTLSIGPEGEVSLQGFTYDPTTYMGAFDAYVKQGTVSLQAGNLAQSGPDKVRISTPQTQLTGNAKQLMINVEAK